MNELLNESLLWMAEAVRTRQVSARELMEAHLERVAEVNPALNAIVELYPEAAMAAAAKADEAQAKGEPLGPLHGVPMTVKGAWDCRGMVNTGGTLGRKGYVAAEDATVIGRMRRAGAIPFGVTNLPEFSFAFESDNLVYGRTANPYGADRTAGGSGGGGAAAIASGCSPFEVGGDLGGSIRVPCHFCGIAGLKPTLGRVPLSGYFPGPFGVVTMLSTAGPMARRVGDLYPLLALMAGPDGVDSTVADAPVRDPGKVDVRRLRIGFHTSNGVVDPTAETVAAVEAAARALQAEEVSMDELGLAESVEIFCGLLGADGCDGLRKFAEMSGTGTTSPNFERAVRAFGSYACSTPEYLGLLYRRDVFRSRVAGFFQKYDALICPVNAYPAMAHGSTWDHLAAFSYTFAHNLSGCPAAVTRYGTSPEGLPIGVQVVAGPWKDHVALAVAEALD